MLHICSVYNINKLSDNQAMTEDNSKKVNTMFRLHKDRRIRLDRIVAAEKEAGNRGFSLDNLLNEAVSLYLDNIEVNNIDELVDAEILLNDKIKALLQLQKSLHLRIPEIARDNS